MRGQPTPTSEALDFSHLPTDRAERCIAFAEQYLTVPKGFEAGEPVRFRTWQKEILRGVFRDGVRTALISMPRGQGKSTLAACIALYGIFADDQEGAHVALVAGSERQARLVFGVARRMCELNMELATRVQVLGTSLTVWASDSTLVPLPAASARLQGQDISMTVVDELAVVPWPTFEAMSLALGKRPDSLLLAISTSPVEVDSAMNHLTELGRAGTEPSFYYKEFSAPAGCAVDDEEAWKIANPALDDFLDREALRSNLRTTRESSFRKFRLNQTVADAGSWLEWGQFEALAAPRPVDGCRIVLGFDGSTTGDSTVLVGATVDPEPHVFVIGAWEAPSGPHSGPGATGWSVPRAEVHEALRAAYSRFQVAELAADPPYWRSELQEWASQYPNVVEFASHSPARMTPATDLVYALIAEKKLTHDGSEVLMRHVRNCVVRATAGGDVVTKDGKSSPRRIDAAIAMILAVSRAVWHANQPVKRYRVGVF